MKAAKVSSFRRSRPLIWSTLTLAGLVVFGGLLVQFVDAERLGESVLSVMPTQDPEEVERDRIVAMEAALSSAIRGTPLPQARTDIGPRVSGGDGFVDVYAEGLVVTYVRSPEGWVLASELRIDSRYEADSNGQWLLLSDDESTRFYARRGDGWRRASDVAGPQRLVALDGETAAVADRSRDGIIELYERSGDSWNKTAELETPGIEARFRGLIVLDGDRVGVIARVQGIDDHLALVFERFNGEWVLDAAFEAPFAESIGFIDDSLVVGTDEEGRGKLRFFQSAGHTWIEVSERSSARFGRDDRSFGQSIGVAEELLIVGAPGQGVDCPTYPHPCHDGLVYVYRRDIQGSWKQHEILVGTQTGTVRPFGKAVHFDDGTIFVGGDGVHAFSVEHGVIAADPGFPKPV